MANEYIVLGVIHDEQLSTTIEVKRMYQEDGGQGIEVVCEQRKAWGQPGGLEVHQFRDLQHAS